MCNSMFSKVLTFVSYMILLSYQASCHYPEVNHLPEVRSYNFRFNSRSHLLNHDICTITHVRTLIECVNLCQMQSDCVSFNYDQTNKNCQLNDVISKELAKDDVYWATGSGYVYYESTTRNKVSLIWTHPQKVFVLLSVLI